MKIINHSSEATKPTTDNSTEGTDNRQPTTENPKSEIQNPRLLDIIADLIDIQYTTPTDYATLFFTEEECKILADPQSALISKTKYQYNLLRSDAALRHKTIQMALDGDEKALKQTNQWAEKQRLRNLLA